MFTSWLLFYFAVTVDGSMVGDDELEAVIVYSRYYLSSGLDRGKKTKKTSGNLSPNSDSNRVPPEYRYKPTHWFRTAPSQAATRIPSAFRVIRKCFKL